ncbi:MAG TPA: hypothetical protein VJ742_12565 [Nitrososphaera sp.]|nr:hypothetical protein [Nitrososphaera sp.]
MALLTRVKETVADVVHGAGKSGLTVYDFAIHNVVDRPSEALVSALGSDARETRKHQRSQRVKERQKERAKARAERDALEESIEAEAQRLANDELRKEAQRPQRVAASKPKPPVKKARTRKAPAKRTRTA